MRAWGQQLKVISQSEDLQENSLPALEVVWSRSVSLCVLGGYVSRGAESDGLPTAAAETLQS